MLSWPAPFEKFNAEKAIPLNLAEKKHIRTNNGPLHILDEKMVEEAIEIDE